MDKQEWGYQKKSFSLPYRGGEIWCEHLDSLGENKTLFERKWREDYERLRRPDTSGLVAVNVAETTIDRDMLCTILEDMTHLLHSLHKVAIVGLDWRGRWYVRRHRKQYPFLIWCTDDFEEAKSWLIPLAR